MYAAAFTLVQMEICNKNCLFPGKLEDHLLEDPDNNAKKGILKDTPPHFFLSLQALRR